jgi:head-tail adaptor
MGMIGASAMDRRLQFRRAVFTDDVYGNATAAWYDHGDPVHCLRQDVKDSEAVTAGVLRSKLMARFWVRSTEFTREITTTDRLVSDGETFEIVAIKNPTTGRRRQLIEITAETAL